MDRKAQCIIFDGDDTLWRTMPLYDRAKQQFQRAMVRIGYDPLTAVGHLDALDCKNVEAYGFSKMRFPLSVVEAYRSLCAQRGIPTSRRAENYLRRSARRVFGHRAPLVPNATAVLQSLQHAHLVLLTKGERSVQRRRIAQSGLRRLFGSVYIVPKKEPKTFEQIVMAQGVQLRHTWSVGDSLRSDVLPALEAGLNAIWVPANTWLYEHTAHSEHPRLHVCQSLAQIPALILTKS
jgi:putative hydrolase of the HAD superfamily